MKPLTKKSKPILPRSNVATHGEKGAKLALGLVAFLLAIISILWVTYPIFDVSTLYNHFTGNTTETASPLKEEEALSISPTNKESWEVMSREYHRHLLLKNIRAKLLMGEGFLEDAQALGKFILKQDDRDHSQLMQCASSQGVSTNALITRLYNVALRGMKPDSVSNHSFFESLRGFFKGMFVVKRVDGNAIHIASSDTSIIIMHLLAERRVEAVCSIMNEDIDLKMVQQAIGADLGMLCRCLKAVENLEKGVVIGE